MAKKQTKKAEKIKPGKKTGKAAAKTPAKKRIAKKEKIEETIPEVKVKPAVPDFAADVVSAESEAATTIKTVESTGRNRKVVSSPEEAPKPSNIEELNRLVEQVRRQANKKDMQQAWQLEQWIKQCNPEADVRLERPSKGVKIQAAFYITLGEDTVRAPAVGFHSTNG